MRRASVSARLLALALFALLVSGGSASATAIQTFPVVADTYSSSENPTTTHGTLSYMKVEGATTIRKSYLRFDVSGVTGTVTRATLRVYTLTSASIGFDVRFVPDNSWGETTLTYNNASAPSATVTTSSGPFASNAWLSLDVTPLVPGNGSYSFAFTTSGSQIQLATKERGASLAAQLEVEYETVVTPPASTTRPEIKGTPEEGQTLTSTNGGWSGTPPFTYTRQWSRCDGAGQNCVNIPGATLATYTLTAADVGATLVVAVTASNSAGSDTAVSAPTGVVTAAVPPANTAAPVISGRAEEASTLSSTTGGWTGSLPLAYAYQWLRCDTSGGPCADIVPAASSTYTLTSADVGHTIRVKVTASNVAGSATATSDPTAVVGPATAVLVAAAGDIACDPASSSFRGGNGTSSSCRQRYTSDLLVGAGLAAVLPLGDLQYDCGGYTAFLNSYNLSWGRVKSITRPAPGNKEYQTSGGTDCDRTGSAAGYYNYFGVAAGDRTRGYYSFDLGSWHLIALNSNCSSVGDCSAGSPQETWLRADLAAHPAACTLAFWHHPRFSSSSVGGTSSVAAFWDALYDAGAELVLNGHAHVYERFGPQTPSANANPARGIREIIVGTGGKSFHNFSGTQRNSEVRNNTTYGVLKLTLRPAGYDWQFLPEAGKTFTDSGSTACH